MKKYISYFVPILVAFCILTFFCGTNTIFAKKSGGTFIKVIENEPSTLDFLFGKDFGALTAATNFYNSLLTYDYNFDLHPELAESWKISGNGLTYTFKLRNDVKWHDGKKFTSKDVVFTF